MKKLFKKIKIACFEITHKVYLVKFCTHGKRVQIEFAALWRWERYNYTKIVESVAQARKIKPDVIRIQSIQRAYWF